MQINDILHIKKEPNSSGYFEAMLRPLSGEDIPVQFSKGAIKKMERLVEHTNKQLDSEQVAAPEDQQNEVEL